MKSWFFEIKRVPQDNWHGCGIACVAAICGATYPRARSEFFPGKKRFTDNGSLCVNAYEMVRVIKKLGFESEIVDEYKSHHLPAIVPFAWHPGEKTTGVHAVVWNPFRKKFIDPGFDHDRMLEKKFYESKWRESHYSAVIVTGRTNSW